MRKNFDESQDQRGLMETALEAIERAIAALDNAGTPSDIAAHLDFARTLLVIQINTIMTC